RRMGAPGAPFTGDPAWGELSIDSGAPGFAGVGGPGAGAAAGSATAYSYSSHTDETGCTRSTETAQTWPGPAPSVVTRAEGCAGAQPHQQLVARHALLGDQIALLPDLLGAAMDGAIEGDGGEPPHRQLVRRVPARGEGGRAGAQAVGRARGETRGCGGEVDRAGLGEGDEEQALPLGAPAGEALAAVLQRDSVEGGGGDWRLDGRFVVAVA